MLRLLLFLFPLAVSSQTVDSVWTEINRQGIRKPDMVMRQAMLETMWLRCSSCSLRFNNLFGFRHKSAVAPDNKMGYLKFDKWQHSVSYYKRWQDKRYKGAPYCDFLNRVGYAESKQYCETLHKLKRRW